LPLRPEAAYPNDVLRTRPGSRRVPRAGLGKWVAGRK
jgi:hypothetical protein